MALRAQEDPHLARTEAGQEPVGFAQLAHQLDQLLVTQRPCRGATLAGLVVGARSDLAAMLTQDLADRLDPEPVTMGVDEID